MGGGGFFAAKNGLFRTHKKFRAKIDHIYKRQLVSSYAVCIKEDYAAAEATYAKNKKQKKGKG